MLNRRRLLAFGVTALGGGAVLRFLGDTPTALSGIGHQGHHGGHVPQPSAGTVGATHVTFTPFTERMPVPPVLRPSRTTGGVDTYTLPIRAAEVDIIPGLRTPALTYGGQFVGPTIRARAGRPVKVAFVNELDQLTNVHLHGGHVSAANDGHPMDLIAPGATRVYDYPNTQRGATLWYHDHTHGLEADHVYRGLHGFYLIHDKAEKRLNLPSGKYDVPIMLRNAQFDEKGALVFGHPDNRTTVLANGKAQPYFPVAARKYRFRLLNASLKHVFRLNMGGVPMTKIASDGGLLPAPVSREELVISSGERVEIVVDFSGRLDDSPLYLYEGENPILRFDVSAAHGRDRSSVPAELVPLPALGAATVERQVSMSFDMSARPPVGLVNGRPFDPDRVDLQVKQGATEIWEIVNADVTPIPFDHPFHMHLVQFQVLSRDGGPPLPEDAGLKDTVYLPPRGTVRIQMTFRTPYTGRYMYHCHYLEHSALGMMAQMEIVP
ncbi:MULTISPECIES: multicopper oxidase family protein [Streptosporangium]|uniref:FtsP/CotA-like multicopper oxidase with cupredoxin domain n=1 Tax=Streptosporangium brasiliense TaxID=47480 RepID=A0ABT9R430_9ACTN|nr:multicopper oxidase family protein [Streptosporangium brasiliense]MDP9863646.1 FtsP/CotA-like multicopper oxidase with cupredoxin domain [Streptosporangium brasiliense]